MPTANNAVDRLGQLLLARMQRTSRLTMYEALVAEGAFPEPDVARTGHLIRHRSELSSWMREVLEDETRGQG